MRPVTTGDTLTFNAATAWRPRNPLNFATPQVSPPVPDPLSPEGDWPIVRLRLLQALERFPEARMSVIDALRELNQLPPLYNTGPVEPQP
jgi:hypothetical protein